MKMSTVTHQGPADISAAEQRGRFLHKKKGKNVKLMMTRNLLRRTLALIELLCAAVQQQSRYIEAAAEHRASTRHTLHTLRRAAALDEVE